MPTQPANPAGAKSSGVSTGVAGLDDVLGGGLTPDRLYLVEGVPGAGKTTLALQFLLEGARRASRCSTSRCRRPRTSCRASPRRTAGTSPASTSASCCRRRTALQPDEQYTMFHPSEVELRETTRASSATSSASSRTRVVFDSLSELRLLAGTSLRYRRQILALKQFFAGRGCTVLLLDDMTADRARPAGAEHRARRDAAGADALRVRRGAAAAAGGQVPRAAISAAATTTTRSRRGGLQVFPRLVAAEHVAETTPSAKLPSGIAALDALLGGGLETRHQHAVRRRGRHRQVDARRAVRAWRRRERGECAALFIFDESIDTLRTRCAGLGMDLDAARRRRAGSRIAPGRPGRAVAGRVRARDPRAR